MALDRRIDVMLVSGAVLFAVEAPAPVLAPMRRCSDSGKENFLLITKKIYGDQNPCRLNPARPSRRKSSSGAESGAAPRSSKEMQVTRLTVADGLGICDFPPRDRRLRRPSQFISGVAEAPRTPLQSHARR